MTAPDLALLIYAWRETHADGSDDALALARSLAQLIEREYVDKRLAEVEEAHGSALIDLREWEDWSNELAMLIHDGDESAYSNPEGAQESIILDVFRVYSDRFIRDAGSNE